MQKITSYIRRRQNIGREEEHKINKNERSNKNGGKLEKPKSPSSFFPAVFAPFYSSSPVSSDVSTQIPSSPSSFNKTNHNETINNNNSSNGDDTNTSSSSSSFLLLQSKKNAKHLHINLCEKPSLSFVYIFSIILFPFFMTVCTLLVQTKYFKVVSVCIFLSFLSFALTYYLIPIFMYKNTHAGLWGIDLAKKKKEEKKEKENEEKEESYENIVPESLGLVCSLIYLTVCIFCQMLFSHDPTKLLEYNAGLLSICFMTFLGFADDVLDLPWRYKMTLPFFASLPLLVAYSGGTTVLLPKFLQSLTGIRILHLGFAYHFYMSFLTVFCTNSINIYAGVNGLEVSQSLVMCVFIVIHNLIEILSNLDASSVSVEAALICEQHFLSLLLSLPFFSTSLGILAFNWYPSRVFVGDTFTLFAGIYFAVVGVLGHFSKTLIFFFIPQILNFVLSLPQLAGIVPCPKHRVPKLNPETGLLESSGNLTVLNVALQLLGPKREDGLVKILIIFQVFCCSISLYVRHLVFY